MPDAGRLKSANLDVINKCNAIALQISAADGGRERLLMETKWFDYRFMSPIDATELFVKCYVSAYRRKWATNFASGEESKKLATRHGNWRSNQTEFTCFWRARQFADELGVPYDLFCDHALEVLLRKGYARPARPNQLYSEKNIQIIAEHVREAWREQGATDSATRI